MTRTRLIPILAVMMLAGVGCQQTPLQRLETARNTYTATLQTLHDLRQANIVTKQQERDMAPTTQAIADTLASGEQAIVIGNATTDPNDASAYIAKGLADVQQAIALYIKLANDFNIDPKTGKLKAK